MLSKEQFKYWMTKLEGHLEEHDEATKAVNVLCKDTACWITVGGGAINDMIALIEILMGNNTDWVSWYTWENDRGRSRMSAGFKDMMKPICNHDDLYELMVHVGNGE